MLRRPKSMDAISQRPNSLCITLLLSLFLQPAIAAERKSYIVYFGKHSHELNEATSYRDLVVDSHYEFLGSILGSKEKAKDSIFYSYTNHINGFAAANLEEEEVSQISKHRDVVSVFRDKGYHLHTTRSWEFMGQESAGKVLPDSLWKKANFGEEIIIANLDTGVWPESESFNDEGGYGTIPSRWKGICQNQNDVDGFRCNRKLVGARYFDKGYVQLVGHRDPYSHTSPRDSNGHGSHTLSTAGGNMVRNASLHGFGLGTIKGGAPRARLAVYKVCWSALPFVGGCFGADILAGIDAAIGDGVDVLSMSLGSYPTDLFDDATAIGTFHAISSGIPVVLSAGNDGPELSSVANVAPWQMTVAASTLDREFPAIVRLGNNKTVKGQSMSQTSLPNKLYPLVMATDVKAPNAVAAEVTVCKQGSLDPEKTKGKIVICMRGDYRLAEGLAVKEAGGVGMILCNDKMTGFDIIPDPHVLPAVHVTAVEGIEILSYMRKTKSPVAYIGKPTTTLQTKPAPTMASFSSKGPSLLTPEILKPDVTAPGVNILASYSLGGVPVISENGAPKFNFMSGTSMACPHVAGIVALLKKVHPDWSPAAIKSAIMTTAFQSDNMKRAIKNGSLVEDATSFDYGSGHVQPNLAADPGLVYDIGVEDYLNFFCAIGYNDSTILKISGHSYRCPSQVPKVSDLNYPSISVVNVSETVTVSRTLKNVGLPGTYEVQICMPPTIEVTVAPTSLSFEKEGEEKKFKVSFKAREGNSGDHVFGRLIWTDGKHHVMSAIVVKP